MATLAQQNVFQCDQCGTPEIVAVPILYQQGTRTFSGLFNHGVSQSISAQAVAPPQPLSYVRKILIWGFAVALCSLWCLTALISFFRHTAVSTSQAEVTAVFLVLWIASIAGMIRSLYRISSYNREVYPKLQSDWAHTFMCRRCGRLFMIP
jgi:hypothetical protein